ncbi:MAG: hypothetical protein P8X61_02275 [Limibacillus sp.]
MRRLLLIPAILLLAACQTSGTAQRTAVSDLAARPSAPDPASLAGQDPGGLTALIGKPTLVRQEASVEIWQYQGASCVLDVFFYPDGATRRVLHLEARDRVAADQQPLEGCLDQVMTAERVRATS